ncbi:fimbrial assembly protein FimA [Alteribacter lacisalsi]|uniref:Fimbrial assembly protein FimA n=1 Tax=Alteribacter lacisalsi TaxID=2045244 RepID=A0A2W0HBH7_9BACI|nr:fimbrial assembly protein FimA [Alteribacter lacisalsi]
MNHSEPPVATFSIIGFDPETKEWGIAVQSKFLGVGAVVPWAKAGVGAVATQSFANTSYGPRGLAMLEEGMSPGEVAQELVKDDDERALRQFAVMDKNGETSAYTGDDCYDWAGHKSGKYCTAQGNILVSEETVDALKNTFEQSEGTLAERLIQALDQAQEAGGDSRGKQSAALFVVQEEGGYGGYNDRKYDLRVDDHPDPIRELKRLLELHSLYFSRPNPNELLDIKEDVLVDVQHLLREEGLLDTTYDTYNPAVKEALKTYFLQENFDERWQESDKIDPYVLTYMKNKPGMSR